VVPSEHGPAIVRQPALLDAVAPAVEFDFGGAQRIELDATSWIEQVPGWLRGSEQLFNELVRNVPWEQRDRWMFTRRVVEPRLTAEYPDISSAPHRLLNTVAAALSSHYGPHYRSLWINLYRNNRDSTSWHGDLIARVEEESIVPY
jgi:alkylated DNA repair dioxygenase AlkB